MNGDFSHYQITIRDKLIFFLQILCKYVLDVRYTRIVIVLTDEFLVETINDNNPNVVAN